MFDLHWRFLHRNVVFKKKTHTDLDRYPDSRVFRKILAIVFCCSRALEPFCGLKNSLLPLTQHSNKDVAHHSAAVVLTFLL